MSLVLVLSCLDQARGAPEKGSIDWISNEYKKRHFEQQTPPNQTKGPDVLLVSERNNTACVRAVLAN